MAVQTEESVCVWFRLNHVHTVCRLLNVFSALFLFFSYFLFVCLLFFASNFMSVALSISLYVDFVCNFRERE